MARLGFLRSRFFWKVYLTFSILFLGFSIAFIWFVSNYFDGGLFHELEATAGLALSRQVSQSVDGLIHNLYILTFAGNLVVLVVGLYLARRVANPISEMLEVAVSLRDGRFEKSVQTLPHDEIGRLGDMLNRLKDQLSSRIRTISRERAQLTAMLTSVVEGIIAVDDNERVLFCNRSAKDFLNIWGTDVRKKKLWQVPQFQPLEEVVRLAREESRFVKRELKIGDVHEHRTLETHATSFTGGRASGVIVVLHDVTELRKLERVRRDFIANVSHEIKTPLTSIKGYVETLIESDDLDEDVKSRFLGKIQKNTGRLEYLVQDILSLARIESHEEHLVSKPVDWIPICHSILGRYENLFHRKSIQVEFKPASEPFMVLGDHEAMTEVLDNLVTNAMKYSQEGGRIKLLLSKDRNWGDVEVVDNGIGIAEKYQHRIFERFYRIDKARSREAGGTGLGLSIVKHLVLAMKGQISVESKLGSGSRFRVRLPLSGGS